MHWFSGPAERRGEEVEGEHMSVSRIKSATSIKKVNPSFRFLLAWQKNAKQHLLFCVVRAIACLLCVLASF